MNAPTLRLTFAVTALAILAAALLIYLLPIAADEAYFVSWGLQLSGGIYDHPPLPAWLSYLASQISPVGYAHRGLALGLGAVSGLALFAFARRYYGQGKLALVLFAALPFNIILFSMYLNDTVLYVCLLAFFLTVGGAWRAQGAGARRLSFAYAILAGFAFGAAMLTKYTASVYFIAFVIYGLLNMRTMWRFMLQQGAVISVMATLLFSLNLIWNYQNCGINFAFNFVLRDSTPDAMGVVQLGLSFVFVEGPLAFLIPWRRLGGLFDPSRLFSGVLVITLIVMAVAAYFQGRFGTHWGMPLAALAILSLVEGVGERCPARLVKFTLGYGLILVSLLIALVAALVIMPQTIARQLDADDAQSTLQIIDIQNGSLIEAITRDHGDLRLATSSYGTTASLEAQTGQAGTVLFNATSVYGRNDDKNEDYAALDGETFLILATSATPRFDTWAAYFDTTERVTLSGKTANHAAMIGRGFNYAAYRADFIQTTLDTFYKQISPRYGACYMDRYRPW